MANQFGIPLEVEQTLRRRDRLCVYCQKQMAPQKTKAPYSEKATIEHLENIGPIYWGFSIEWFFHLRVLKEQDLAICCGSCNSSRGKQELREWFKTPYCLNRETPINETTVAEPVRAFLERNPELEKLPAIIERAFDGLESLLGIGSKPAPASKKKPGRKAKRQKP